MEDCDQEMASITIRCLLCRGYVLYKDGDINRFKVHLANQHGAFFDIEYLLASCFMDEAQKISISKPFVDSLKGENLDQHVNDNEYAEAQDPKPKVKKEKSSKVKSPKVKPFPCDGCPKSYGSKQTLKNHTRIEHKTVQSTEDVITAENQIGDTNSTSLAGIVEESSYEEPAPEDPTSENPTPEEPNAEESATEVSLKEQVEMTFSSAADNLLEELNKELETLDSSMDVTIDETEKTVEENNDLDSKKKGKKKKSEKGSNSSSESKWKALSESLAKQGIHISQSSYFSKTKQVISNGEKYSDKFTEVVPGLPDNWKLRTVEAKDKGKVVLHKHFLSPEGVLMKSTMAVVEYLRIEGKLKPDDILEVAKTLKVGNRKLQKLFSNDATEPELAVEA